jgi:uncharacterized protein (DUF2267 family)
MSSPTSGGGLPRQPSSSTYTSSWSLTKECRDYLQAKLNYNYYLLSLANKMNDSSERSDAMNIRNRSLEILRELLAKEHARGFQDVLDQHNALWYYFDITLNFTAKELAHIDPRRSRRIFESSDNHIFHNCSSQKCLQRVELALGS